MGEKIERLVDFDREEFIHEITNNFDKWEKPTNRDDLAQYLIDKNFTTKSLSSLKIAKKKLRDIVVLGEEQAKEKEKNSPTPLSVGNDIMDFIEDMKHDIHKEKMNPFVKKFATKKINDLSEKVQDENLLEKLGILGYVVAFILVAFEMMFKHGYKGVKERYNEFRAKKQAEKAQAQQQEARP